MLHPGDEYPISDFKDAETLDGPEPVAELAPGDITPSSVNVAKPIPESTTSQVALGIPRSSANCSVPPPGSPPDWTPPAPFPPAPILVDSTLLSNIRKRGQSGANTRQTHSRTNSFTNQQPPTGAGFSQPQPGEDGLQMTGVELVDQFNESLVLLGDRRALPGEQVVFEIEDTCQLTNFRVIQRQSTSCMRASPNAIAVDAWLKDITCVEVTKENYSNVLLLIGVVLILGGVVNYEELGIHFTEDFRLGLNLAPIVFYILGALVLITGQMLRRTCIVLGVVGQTQSQCFTVPLKESDVWKVNDCVDLIRLLQMPFALRKQRDN